ncbi:MAG: two-component system response regulator [Bacteroidetes bacterium HGW-Bacteroidetes-1]|jgi:DNA-binding response OmpR family regulator|nr:MAG: two-component system response regulator [Bacteroidetes bacterium HGW-Bacteroidetes-1]
MEKIRILWADDEIDMLRPHIIFLEHKGYEVETTNNGDEALDLIREKPFDIIFLDENMPGLSGIETLEQIKKEYPNLPVVMITKSEEESIMEDAIGSKIADYLIKPVKPNQILLSLKRNLENRKLVSEKTTMSYQQEFRQIGLDLSNQLNFNEWSDVYKKLVRWELDLEQSKDDGIMQVLHMQQDEANNLFSRFIERNYVDWLNSRSKEKPVLSHTLFKEKILPRIDSSDKPLFVVLIDNLRYDQWKSIQPLIDEFFRIESDELYYSILPTTTQYARNALFAGLMPDEIRKKYPHYWTDEEDEGTKNQFESELLGEQLRRNGKDIRYSYNKILNLNAGKKMAESMSNLMVNKLNVIVYNFVDMLSHVRTEMEMIRELAEDEPAYRSLMLSWFRHSSLFDIIRFIASKKCDMIITTDHGSVYVKNPVKILGDRTVNTNLRYKYGKSLKYNAKEMFEVRDPEDIFLPRINVSTAYVFARANDFFAYPNNYNYYVNYYKNTFQHGGISMQEIMVPFIYLKAK